MSVRSVFFNVFQNLIIVLYVFDQDTNTVIRISTIVGLGIEIWKVTKVQDVSFDFENKVFGLIPRLKLDDKKDYEDSGTKEFDRMAFRYLGMALFPLAFCYCIYSVIYNEHKGWYSFILGSMYGFLLTFGFIMMTPQLFINYKLKSVAHLPWRMMTYKALNTFIDDIFAFVIKMPTMYRIGCFRLVRKEETTTNALIVIISGMTLCSSSSCTRDTSTRRTRPGSMSLASLGRCWTRWTSRSPRL